jgi:hypothetical protein
MTSSIQPRITTEPQGDATCQDDPEAPWQVRDQTRRDAPADSTAFAALEKEEQKAWIEDQRKIQHAWAKWMRWRNQSPQLADAYRQEHQAPDGGDRDWLIKFASLRVPRAPARQQQSRKVEGQRS